MLYWIIALFHLVVMPIAAVHALIYKRDHRAALGWIGVILLFPVAGPLLYFLFGINRLRTKAQVFTGHHLPVMFFGYDRTSPPLLLNPDPLIATLPNPDLARVGSRATGQPLLPGNQANILINGEAFFPELLRSIEEARHWILLSTYLFGHRGEARAVIDALIRAKARGVAVYVLADGIGTSYSWRIAIRALRRADVSVALFTPPSLLPPSLDINLRNHRKIAVVDQQVGFFGGINIDDRHMVANPDNRHPTEDVHFRVNGPLVAELTHLFCHDWDLVTGQKPALTELPCPTVGRSVCRLIDDGPHDNLNHLSMTLIGVFTAARERIRIMVPYFLPNHEMVATLQAAVLRGVKVEVILPERSNLRFVDWATRNMLWELLLWDMDVFYKAAPFAHSKLILVDDAYAMTGSANLDARSLRLNFELGVEWFDPELTQQLHAHLDEATARSRRITLAELDQRPLWQRLRDAFFWLFSSYL
ncbi:phospholipase D-like domain-containing protein [Marinimicrobium sp. LS-A18]|uniref:phospholipase D-like domain-containing protein n=1 Tax=Marinimicrobium sp. LS-A18 TaxID=1381596 RepID=UPI0004650CB7|nr:phospholipase D-like domain-containing protein [Marinimicrobium sp. LS-A18]